MNKLGASAQGFIDLIVFVSKSIHFLSQKIRNIIQIFSIEQNVSIGLLNVWSRRLHFEASRTIRLLFNGAHHWFIHAETCAH